MANSLPAVGYWQIVILWKKLLLYMDLLKAKGYWLLADCCSLEDTSLYMDLLMANSLLAVGYWLLADCSPFQGTSLYMDLLKAKG